MENSIAEVGENIRKNSEHPNNILTTIFVLHLLQLRFLCFYKNNIFVRFYNLWCREK